MMRRISAALAAAAALALASAREARAQAVVVSSDAVTVDEGSTATFTVRLGAAPVAPVDVEVTNTLGLAAISAAPNPMAFDAANWNVDRTVTVTHAIDGDDIDNGATLTLRAGGLDVMRVVVTAVDTSPAPPAGRPSARISLPRNGDVVSGTRAEFFGDGNPVGGAAAVQAQFFIDGVLAFTEPGPGHYHLHGGHGAWDTTGLSDGPHVLRLTVTDDAVPARTGSHEVTVLVNNGSLGVGGSSGGGGGCGATGLEGLILYPLLRAFRRRRWD